MAPSDFDYGRAYRELKPTPLHPDDPRYVPLFERRELSTTDPVRTLMDGILWSGNESVQLLSGFRGTGKSTALLRLERDLRREGLLVVRCDMEDVLNLSTPVEIGDFLLSVAGALGDAVREPENGLLPPQTKLDSYWERFLAFWIRQRSATVEGLDAGGLRLSLKADPTFKERLQQEMSGRLGRLVEDVREYLDEILAALRQHHGARPFVLLLDSVEHIRGSSQNAAQVEASLENLFALHADKLRFPGMHLVLTVPPWLKIRSPGVEGNFDGGVLIPCVKVHEPGGERFAPGIDALVEVVGRRLDWQRLLGEREQLVQLILASGGYLRDLFRLLREAIHLSRQHEALPLDRELVERAEASLRDDYLPLAREDLRWLARVARSHGAGLLSQSELSTLSRYFDTHLVLTYRNGSEWYDVHPLLRETVLREAGEGAESGEA